MTQMACAVTVGSLHYDIVVQASHRPAAGETVTGNQWFPKFGGKGGNQAVAVARAGCASRMVSAIGDDEFGAFLMSGLSASGVETKYVAQLKDTRSGMSVAISDATGDYGAVIVSGANLHIDPATLDSSALWENAAVLVLQNEIPEEINLVAARKARAAGLEVILNAAPYRPLSEEMISLVTILIANAGEAEALCGVPVNSLASAMTAAQTLGKQFPAAIVTAGGDGVAIAQGGELASFAALPVELISTHGAGDCFTGTLAAEIVKGSTLRDATQIANEAASRLVSQRDEKIGW